MHTTPELLTTAEVAAALHRSPETVNRWVRLGRLVPTIQLPGTKGARLFDPAIVDQLRGEADR